ncbi:MAG: cadherin-like beta sandwich domain-containing protein [Bacilli bacterium]|nr:cadherin-like beta sandwich domain-containing protein [Bacilli bacterium]
MKKDVKIMKNRGNINKGWNLVMLVMILFINSLFIPNVLATELEIVPIEEEDTVVSVDNYQEKEVIDNNKEDSVVEVGTLSKEEIFTNYSNGMDFQENVVIVKGNIQEETTVEDVIANIKIEELVNNYSLEKVMITDEMNNILSSEDVVTNLCHIVFIGSDYVSRYQVSFLGDLNQDNLLTEEDVEEGIDQFLEVEEIEKVEVKKDEEVSYVDYVINNNTYEVEVPFDEEISVSWNKNDNIEKYVEDEVRVELKLDGFSNNYINTISGNVDYDLDILELENIYVLLNDRVVGDFRNNKFIYVLDEYKDGNNTLLVMVFRGLKKGVSNISLKNLNLLMNGNALKFIGNTSLEIVINENGKGGDVDNYPDNGDGNSNEGNVRVEENVVVNKVVSLNKKEFSSIKRDTSLEEDNSSKVVATTIALSNNNYLEDISIKGYELKFVKDVSYYEIVVENNVQSLKFNVVLSDDNAFYTIAGNDNFKVGKNEVILTVFAEDGSSRDYVIEVNKKEKKNSEGKEKFDGQVLKQDARLIIIIGLVITTSLILYRLLRKEED